MFKDSTNLEYINLNNFDENKLVLYNDIFSNIKENVVICINENITNRKILPQITNIKCHMLDCSTDWKLNKIKKIIIENKTECFKYSLKEIIEYILNNERDEMEKSKEKEINCYDYILKIIEQEFTSENYDTYNLDNGLDEHINAEKLLITFTTLQNQKNNNYNNMTSIDLGECETLLRNFYNITNNETLYMKKIDIYQEGMNAVKIEYDVYTKLFGNKLIKLNLSICEQSKISIKIPFKLTQHIDKYNSSSGYYNDICYSTTSQDGTDISLKDRQKEFIDKDKIICQENCDFLEYNYDTLVAECSCKVKECSKSFADMNINKAKILDNFKNIKNYINFNFLLCYKKLFKKESILNNVGFYLIFIIILFHIITIFLFKMKHFSLLVNKIKKIICEIIEKHSVEKIVKKNKKNKQKIHGNNINKIYIYKNKNKRESRYIYNKHISNKNLLSEVGSERNSKIKNINKNKHQFMRKFIDEEINGFSYKIALRIDKRTYCQYYESFLKTQHNLIYAIFNNNDYNSQIIKINLFIIGFTIEYEVNALFYNDDTMHKIYENKGDFNIETQIPIAIYSTFISTILNIPLNFLALSNDAILSFKYNNIKYNIIKQAKFLKKKLKIKFILYFNISLLLLIFIWFYISMFGVIYKNTQMHLLKDTLISFGLSLVYPFAIYLFPGIFRMIALSKANKKRECLYTFSKLLQSF